MSECLLLTATINPDASISAGWYRSTTLDPEKRYFEYLDALAFYLVLSGFSKIVFCENSNYPIHHAEGLLKLASALGKELEFVQFEGDSRKTVEFGYGYGDGECIDHAVERSKLLRSSKNWYKCSGRYKIENIGSVLDAYENDDRVFFKGFWKTPFAACTAFFKSDTEFYERLLRGAGNDVDRKRGVSLEYVYYNRLREPLFRKTKASSTIPKLPQWSPATFRFEKCAAFFGLASFWRVSFLLDRALYWKFWRNS